MESPPLTTEIASAVQVGEQRTNKPPEGPPSAKHPTHPTSQAESLQSPTNTTIINTADLQSQPISIPTKQSAPRDPDRVATPLSGRGDRRGHLFPFSRTPSPAEQPYSQSPTLIQPARALLGTSLDRRRRSSSSHSGRLLFEMHDASRYAPTSPLSPRLPASHQALSPQPRLPRPNQHSRQNSRGLQVNLGRYHPANLLSNDTSLEQPRSPSPSTTRQRPPQSLEMMRERQRELIDRARMSAKIAASPMGIKPGAPRLDPLGSPKGPVTPLLLEEAPDYFSAAVSGDLSPARSPGPKSDESDKDGNEPQPEQRSKSDLPR